MTHSPPHRIRRRWFVAFIAVMITAGMASVAPQASARRRPKPKPSPTASPSPTPTSTQTPSPTASPSPAPSPSPSGTPAPSPILVPANGALFGAFVDKVGYWVDNATAQRGVEEFEATIGRKLAVNHHYYAWTNKFPSGLEQWDLAGGRIPLISWLGTNLDSILSGTHDAMIRARADGLKALGQKVFLRWGWEMNGNWYPWDGLHNNDAGTYNGPQKYVAAWRHIHGLFAERGATNVVWVWNPNHESVPNQSWNSWRNYYPGDAYVDWVGIDGYNWGTTRSWSRWKSFAALMSGVYNDYAATKPIMIGETSSVEAGGSKAAWIDEARAALRITFPAVKAFLWFDVNKEEDWRAESSPSSLASFRAMAGDPYMNP